MKCFIIHKWTALTEFVIAGPVFLEKPKAQAVRNYLKILSCVEGDYDTKKIEGKNYIFQRHHDN